MRLLFPFLLGVAMPAAAQDHGGHEGHEMPAAEPIDPHAGHKMPAPPVGNAPAPQVPTDHAADAIHNPDEMAKARAALRIEGGGMAFGMVLVDRAEVQLRDGSDGWRWAGEAWLGGDIDRLKIKTEGEGELGGEFEAAEVQALYSHALDPWWNLQTGVRHDFSPDPSRSYAVLGIEGVAPYWFHIEGSAFVSTKGAIHLRGEASLDQRITQRLIVQPAIEANFALQDVGALGIGSGLSYFEAGVRLRYEIVPEFAPYIGVEWHRKSGDTARRARLAGEDVSGVSAVAGLRFWF